MWGEGPVLGPPQFHSLPGAERSPAGRGPTPPGRGQRQLGVCAGLPLPKASPGKRNWLARKGMFWLTCRAAQGLGRLQVWLDPGCARVLRTWFSPPRCPLGSSLPPRASFMLHIRVLWPQPQKLPCLNPAGNLLSWVRCPSLNQLVKAPGSPPNQRTRRCYRSRKNEWRVPNSTRPSRTYPSWAPMAPSSPPSKGTFPGLLPRALGPRSLWVGLPLTFPR